ncbi:tyrosine-type recombinase/integrase [Planctomycetota bacterium]
MLRTKKPNKPYADFPLYAHAGGVWAKKIRGKVHYFGPWSDPNSALELYLAQRDFLLGGHPVPDPKQTVGHLLDEFLGEKQSLEQTGDIAPATFREYESICERIHAHFGKRRNVDTLTVGDFRKLRTALAKNAKSPHTLKRNLTIARMVFSDQPQQFRKALRSPTQKSIRKARTERFYEAESIRLMVKNASPEFKAMILLGINCAFGPKDCCTLPRRAVNLNAGWCDYPRPKTEVDRHCPLWKETIAAIRPIIGKQLVFEDRYWDRGVVATEFKTLCDDNGIESTGFYSLRRTFETIATTADVSQAVVDSIMGHVGTDMASIYRQKIFDEQLIKCSEHVRAWYLGEIVIR